MPSGAKKRKAEKKKKEQRGKAGTNHGNGESKGEAGVVDAGGMEEPKSSAVDSAGAVDVKDSPATEVDVRGKEEGKISSGSSDSSSDSSSDEEKLGVDLPISDTVAAPASALNGSDAVDDEGQDVGVEIEGKVGSFVDESKARSEYSTGHVDDLAEEVVVEATPPISESDLVVESVVSNTAPSSEGVVDVVKPVEVEIRETVPENQGVEQSVGGPASSPVERTSWRSCCGLFELFSSTR